MGAAWLEKLRSSSRRLLERRAGGLPLPILLILIVLLGCLGLFPATSGGLAMALVLLPVAAICSAAIGERFAALRGLGIDTIIALVLPSYLAHLGWIRPGVLQDIRDVFERADVLGWIIAVLVFGGVLSIDRTALARTAAGIVVPVVVASLAAAGVGIAAGALLGEDPVETFFFVVAPIMGGGIGAGAIPLSAGYADNLGRSGGEILGTTLSAVVIGNLAAIVLAGILARRDGDDPGSDVTPASASRTIAPSDLPPSTPRRKALFAGAAAIVGLYLAAAAAARMFDLPAPLTLIACSIALHLGRLVSEPVRDGALAIYRVVVSRLIFLLLVTVGLVLIPWTAIVEGFVASRLAVALAVVVTLAAVGHLASRAVRLPSIDGATIALTRAAMGGTGDVAILAAGNRLRLMPFAQLVTRIGGAATVAAALTALRVLQG